MAIQYIDPSRTIGDPLNDGLTEATAWADANEALDSLAAPVASGEVLEFVYTGTSVYTDSVTQLSFGTTHCANGGIIRFRAQAPYGPKYDAAKFAISKSSAGDLIVTGTGFEGQIHFKWLRLYNVSGRIANPINAGGANLAKLDFEANYVLVGSADDVFRIGAADVRIRVWNNAITTNGSSASDEVFNLANSASFMWAYCNSIWGAQNPSVFEATGSGYDYANNVFWRVTQDVTGVQSGLTTNYIASDDGTAVGTGNITLTVNPFVAPALNTAGDMTMTVAAQSVLNVGAASANTNFSVTDDINGVARGAGDYFIGCETVPSAGGTTKSVSDSGTALDSVALPAVSLALTDAGAGLDAFAGPSTTYAIADVGAGADSTQPSALMQLAEVSSSLESAGLSGLLTLQDAAAGAEATGLAVTLAVGEVGLSSELLSVLTAAMKLVADTGSGSDAVTLATNLIVLDSGAAADQPLLTAALNVTDAGSAIDTLLALTDILKTVADIGTGAEAVSTSALLQSTEAGTATDTPTVAVALSLQELASATEVITTLQALQKTVTDLGSAVENMGLSVSLTLPDTGSGSDAVDASTFHQAQDTGSVSELLTTLQSVLKSVSDIGSAVDGLFLSIALSLPDGATGADAASADASLPIQDTGTALEAVSTLQSILKLVSDAATAIDALTLSVDLPVADAGAGTDDTTLQAMLALLESVGATDLVVSHIPGQTRITTIRFTLKARSMTFTLH